MEEFLVKIIPNLITPAVVMIVGYLVKQQMKKLELVDKMPGVLFELKTIKEKLIEIRLEMEKFEKHREEFILTKSEVKSQWRRIDELSNRLKSA